MIEKTAGSLGELIAQVKSIGRAWSPFVQDEQELWFRGQSRPFDLLPCLYRENLSHLHYSESRLFERFKSLATPFIKRPHTEWDWYFLAQHHGLPTRLLDWSESLLAATYFALSGDVFKRDRLALDDDLGRTPCAHIFDADCPTVWILNPTSLNESLHGDRYLYVPSPDGDVTPYYLPDRIEEERLDINRLPFALLPPRSNERIAAQQGVFTIHGHSPESLNLVADTHVGSSQIQLARVLLDRANISHLWEELQLTGINRLSLFPDIDSVAEYVKWTMQSAK